MKIALLSDIHLSMGSMAFPSTEADVTVLAGDVGRPVQAISWASAAEMPCLFVAGNHEFYGSDLVSTCSELRRLSRASRYSSDLNGIIKACVFLAAPYGRTIVSSGPRKHDMKERCSQKR